MHDTDRRYVGGYENILDRFDVAVGTAIHQFTKLPVLGARKLRETRDLGNFLQFHK